MFLDQLEVPRSVDSLSLLIFFPQFSGAVQCAQCQGTGVNSEDHFNGRFKAGGLCWLCRINDTEGTVMNIAEAKGTSCVVAVMEQLKFQLLWICFDNMAFSRINCFIGSLWIRFDNMTL
ncbi:hypothetical protein SDJN02_17932, partial [Cucurbita argyrosperma subsp. argyrosperma]